MRGDDERAYVDRPVEAFGEAAALAQQAAAEWRLGEPTLIRTGMNAIFGAGNTVLRVGRPNGPASASIELAERLNDQGIRVVRPRRDDALERGADKLLEQETMLAEDIPDVVMPDETSVAAAEA